jgi:hypothetical protein
MLDTRKVFTSYGGKNYIVDQDGNKINSESVVGNIVNESNKKKLSANPSNLAIRNESYKPLIRSVSKEIIDLEPTIWYDTSTTDNIIKDGSNFVSQITDLSGNNYHALQTVGTFKAKWNATYNAVVFDGSYDHYDIVTPYGNNPADLSNHNVFLVFARPFAGGDNYPRMLSSITDSGLFDFQVPNFYIRANIWGSGTGSQDVTAKGIQITTWVDQRILGSDLRLGENAQTDGLQNTKGHLFEIILFRRVLDQVETNLVIDYLTTKHGL